MTPCRGNVMKLKLTQVITNNKQQLLFLFACLLLFFFLFLFVFAFLFFFCFLFFLVNKVLTGFLARVLAQSPGSNPGFDVSLSL